MYDNLCFYILTVVKEIEITCLEEILFDDCWESLKERKKYASSPTYRGKFKKKYGKVILIYLQNTMMLQKFVISRRKAKPFSLVSPMYENAKKITSTVCLFHKPTTSLNIIIASTYYTITFLTVYDLTSVSEHCYRVNIMKVGDIFDYGLISIYSMLRFILKTLYFDMMLKG